MQASVERTTRWLARCKEEMARLNSLDDTINKHQMLFGINQGGVYEDIRIEHAQQIAEMDLDGYPSRNGRHGHVYTKHGKLNLFNAKFELDERPIEEGCQCPACRRYSRAYIRHLLKAKEMLGMRLCVLHNLYFYNNMMTEIRTALDEGNFASYKRAKLAGFEEYDKK